MAFSSYLRFPLSRVEHPEDEEEDMRPMPRSGSVRAFSHLPEDAAPPQPQEVLRRSSSIRPFSHLPEHEGAVANPQMLPRSGSVHAFSHLPESAEEDHESGHSAALQARAHDDASDPDIIDHRFDGRDIDPGIISHDFDGKEIDPGIFAEPPKDDRNSMRGPGFGASGLRPAPDSTTDWTKSRLFEQRQPAGLRDQAVNLSDIPDAAFLKVAGAQPQQGSIPTLKGRLAPLQTHSQSNDAIQQSPGAVPTPKDTVPQAAASALQEHNRPPLLDESDPGPPPKQRVEGTSSKNKPQDQFEKEKAAYEKAKATAAANHHANEQNKQTLKAWQNYERAIQLMEKTPEGKKVLDHLRNDKTRVFKVIMVNDPVKDSYMGVSIKPGAQGQYVDTGKKDESGREIHVLFLTKSALEGNTLKPDGTVNPDAEALEKVWHELYHASERHLSGAADPLETGTGRRVDRLSQQQSAHERRAVRFENIIRARNGGVRMKNKYGGRYVRGPDGQTRIVDVINVPEEQPPWYVPKQ